MKQRFYLDTSVFGGVFDKEFEQESLLLFERIKLGQVICLFSDLTEDELIDAPKNVQEYFRKLPNEFLERLEVNNQALDLANKYVEEKVVGETSFDDCVHIALATINKVDLLTSWNFKHIVNIYRIRGYNSVNLKNNYQTIEIRSPKEIIKYENKTEVKSKKEFDSVDFFREVKTRISKKIYGKSLAEIKEYFRKRKLELKTK